MKENSFEQSLNSNSEINPLANNYNNEDINFGVFENESTDLTPEIVDSPEQQEAKLIDQFGEDYNDVILIEESVGRLINEVAENKKALEDMRGDSDQPQIDPDFKTASENALDEQQKVLGEKISAIKGLEKTILDYPESDSEDVENVQSKIQKFAEEARELEEEMEQTMREQREEYIVEMYKSSLEEMNEYFKEDFEESENGEKAKKILEVKLWYSIINKQKKWIETGENDGNNGWRVTLESKKIKAPQGEKIFITNIGVERENFVSEPSDIEDIMEINNEIEKLDGLIQNVESNEDIPDQEDLKENTDFVSNEESELINKYEKRGAVETESID